MGYGAAMYHSQSTASLNTEKPHLLECNPGANPPGLSFDTGLDPSHEAPASCEYYCVGGDFTIISPLKSSPPLPGRIIESVMATDNVHFQDNKRLKLMWPRKKDTITGAIINRGGHQ